MVTVVESLRSLSAYPIPMQALVAIIEVRGLTPHDPVELTSAYHLAEADVYMWLSNAPDVSQGGQSFSFSDEQRSTLRSRAKAIYSNEGDTKTVKQTIYGYKGTRL